MVAIGSFTATLVGDVIASRETLSATDTQVNRRNLVRASIAAVEGLVWLCRQHVRDTAHEMGELTPLADMALREQTYSVTKNGEVVEATRYISLASSIRLIAKQARHINAALIVNFEEPGWQRVLAAIEIRNRITHPKTILDLDASDIDLATVGQGVEWLLGTATEILTAVVAAFSEFNDLSAHLLKDLKGGHPGALKLYQEQLLRD